MFRYPRWVHVTFAVGLLGLGVGCGGAGTPLPDAQEVSGTITVEGKSPKDVQVVFSPRGQGHLAGCVVGEGGTFNVKTIPGEFVVHFVELEKGDRAKAKAGLNTIPQKYREANPDHRVTLSGGSGNKIELK
jgi:hypothetical protein